MIIFCQTMHKDEHMYAYTPGSSFHLNTQVLVDLHL